MTKTTPASHQADQVRVFLLQASGPPTITLEVLDTHPLPALLTFDSQECDRPSSGPFSELRLQDAAGGDIPVHPRSEAALRLSLHSPFIGNHFAGTFSGLHDDLGRPWLRRRVLVTQGLLALCMIIDGRPALPQVKHLGHHHATADLHPETACIFVYDRHSTLECASAHEEIAKRAAVRPEMRLLLEAFRVDPDSPLTLTA